MNASTWSRDDVTEPLVEELGFTPDPDARSILFRRGDDAQLTIVDGSGTVTFMHNNPLWSVAFTGSVPAPVILAAVREAVADCPEHGTACEADDHVEPPTVNGEVI
jgi:hypothetical protein